MAKKSFRWFSVFWLLFFLTRVNRARFRRGLLVNHACGSAHGPVSPRAWCSHHQFGRVYIDYADSKTWARGWGTTQNWGKCSGTLHAVLSFQAFGRCGVGRNRGLSAIGLCLYFMQMSYPAWVPRPLSNSTLGSELNFGKMIWKFRGRARWINTWRMFSMAGSVCSSGGTDPARNWAARKPRALLAWHSCSSFALNWSRCFLSVGLREGFLKMVSRHNALSKFCRLVPLLQIRLSLWLWTRRLSPKKRAVSYELWALTMDGGWPVQSP